MTKTAPLRLSGALLMAAFQDAGLPPGVLGYLTGSGGDVGDALVRHPEIAGVTFTGSYAVGIDLLRHFAGGRWQRPCIAEMGGTNAVIVSRRADLDRAPTGIGRSAAKLVVVELSPGTSHDNFGGCVRTPP